MRLHLGRPFHRVFPSGLWIPSRPDSSDGHVNPAQIAATYVSYSQVFDVEPTWEDAAERLRKYNLSTILSTIGGISGALHPSRALHSTETQVALVRWLFRENPSQVLQAVDELLNEVKGAGTDLPNPVVVFHDLQLVNAAKMALLEVPPDNATTTDSPKPLGEALLAVSDLLAPEETPGEMPDRIRNDADRRAWTSYFLVNGRFHGFGNPMHELARSHELYLTDRPHLRDESGAYMDLPSTAEDLTGMPLEELLARNTAVYSRWAKGIDKNSGELPGSIQVSSYFTKNLDFDKVTEMAFWREMSASAEQLRDAFRSAGCGEGELRPYYLFPLEKRPLVRHEGWAHCPSTLLLGRKVGAGLHYLFLNRLESEQEGDRYLTYFGSVFEDYVTNVVDGMLSDGPATFVSEETLESIAPEGTPVCDGVIVLGDTVLPIEVKSPRLKLDARTEGQWNEIEEFLKKVFLHGARQLDSTIELIRSGSLSKQGLAPERIRVYLPVVITLEPTPMQPPLYNLVRSLHGEKGLLSGPYTKPLQQLTVEELEMLEAVTNHGREGFRLLRKRVDQGGHQLPFKGWAWQYDSSIAEMQNDRLTGTFEEMVEGAVEYLRSRSTSSLEEG